MEQIKKRPSLGLVVTFLILALIALMVIIPFIWMLSTSFDAGAISQMPFPPRFWPKDFSLRPYEVVLKNIPIFRYFFNTIIVTAGIIVVSTTSAMLAGYSFSKLRFKGYRLCMILALSVLMIPQEVVMIPQYLLFATFKLTNNYVAFWLPGICYVFGTFFAKQYMDTIPNSIREAAMIDGAREFYIFTRVLLPLCSTVIATLGIILFLYGWNDLLWPLLILRDSDKFTMQIGIAFFKSAPSAGGTQGLPAVHMAAALISVVPVVAVYLFLQRYIVESIALSGVKQ